MVNRVWEVSGAPSSSGAPLSSCTSSTALMCHWNSTTLKWSIIKGTSLMGPSLWGPVTVPSDKSTARPHGRVSMVSVQRCRFHVCSTIGRSVLIARDSWLSKWCFHSWGRGSVDKVRIQNTGQLDVWQEQLLRSSFFYIMDRAQYASIWLYNPDERDIMTDWHSKSPVCAGAHSHLTTATSELVFHSTAMKLDNRKTSPASWVWRGKESGRNVDFSAAPASHNAWPS